MQNILVITVLILPLELTRADIYLHNPRGSNNRLDESTPERRNANRLFDSQNNARGGYLQGNMNFYVGSRLQIEWTNQHSCKSSYSNCEIIIQYMCDENVRDGSTTETIPELNSQCANQNCSTDFQYGMHEDNAYYAACKSRARNSGLFLADQRLRGNTAIFTRQNPNGERYGYECPEERDYYPYWAPTNWVDVAILTNDVKKCSFYQQESENVKNRWFCANANIRPVPIDKVNCEKNAGDWIESPAHNVNPPICQETQFTRDNHLGNTLGGNPPIFNWILPQKPSNRCILRIRYNISTNDYDGWSQTQQSNQNFIALKMNLSQIQANQRGYVFKNNPAVQIFPDLNMTLNLAINTAQYGRVFQDRSFAFSIMARNFEPNNKVHNLNVRGKRGNIVQVYPSVEYDYVPNQLELSVDDYIHIQWTGSNKNPPNFAGQGLVGSDRSNIVELKNKNFGSSQNFFAPLSQFGTYSANLPAHLNNTSFLGLSNDDLVKLAILNPNQHGGGMTTLDDASTYFDLGPRKVISDGVFHYMCTRNNDFSNRDQKGRIIAYDFNFEDAYVGWMGGNLQLDDGQIVIPQGAFSDLTYIRVDQQEFTNISDIQFPSDSLGSDFITLHPVENQINAPLKYQIRAKRSSGLMESASLYRISPTGVVSKISASVNDNQVEFESDQIGTYVLKYDSNYGLLVGILVGVLFLVGLVIAVAIFLFKNPNFFRTIRYRASTFKRSMADQI